MSDFYFLEKGGVKGESHRVWTRDGVTSWIDMASWTKLGQKAGHNCSWTYNLDMEKEYWRLKKREQRSLQKMEEKLASLTADMPCPNDVDPEEWSLACQRARGSRRYAEMFPEHVRPSEIRFQDPLWQLENEVRRPEQRRKNAR